MIPRYGKKGETLNFGHTMFYEWKCIGYDVAIYIKTMTKKQQISESLSVSFV